MYDLQFPSDYNRCQTFETRIYSMGAMRPFGTNDIWYESKKTFTKYYRNIPVQFRIVLNKNGTFRYYKIVQVGEDDYRLWSNGKIPTSSEVRVLIDNHYAKFEAFMSEINSSESHVKSIFEEVGLGHKAEDIYEDGDLYEATVRWVLCRRFNRIQKRVVLKNLMNKGLPIDSAIRFFSFIN